MKNIILLTHGDFSKGITQSCNMIIGDEVKPIPLSIQLDTSISAVHEMLDVNINKFPENETVFLMTDIPGGSTTRAAISMLSNHKNLVVISGLNLGLLLEISMLELTGNPMEDQKVVREIIEQVKDTIKVINDIADSSSELSDDGEL